MRIIALQIPLNGVMIRIPSVRCRFAKIMNGWITKAVSESIRVMSLERNAVFVRMVRHNAVARMHFKHVVMAHGGRLRIVQGVKLVQMVYAGSEIFV